MGRGMGQWASGRSETQGPRHEPGARRGTSPRLKGHATGQKRRLRGLGWRREHFSLPDHELEVESWAGGGARWRVMGRQPSAVWNF